MPRPNDVGVGVAAVVLDDRKRVLLLRRRGAHAAGCWSVPGGWLDRSDTDAGLAAIREAGEETGLMLRHVVPWGWTTEDHADLGVRCVTLYHVTTHIHWHGDPIIREPAKCDALEFFALDALPSPLFPGLADVLWTLRDAVLS